MKSPFCFRSQHKNLQSHSIDMKIFIQVQWNCGLMFFYYPKNLLKYSVYSWTTANANSCGYVGDKLPVTQHPDHYSAIRYLMRDSYEDKACDKGCKKQWNCLSNWGHTSTEVHNMGMGWPIRNRHVLLRHLHTVHFSSSRLPFFLSQQMGWTGVNGSVQTMWVRQHH